MPCPLRIDARCLSVGLSCWARVPDANPKVGNRVCETLVMQFKKRKAGQVRYGTEQDGSSLLIGKVASMAVKLKENVEALIADLKKGQAGPRRVFVKLSAAALR